MIASLELASLMVMEVEILAILVLIARNGSSEILWLVVVSRAQSKLQQYIDISRYLSYNVP